MNKLSTKCLSGHPDKAFKIISNIVYAIGCAIVLVLALTCFLGLIHPVNPSSMLYEWRRQAFFMLLYATIPMLAACFAVYFSNKMHKQSKKALKFFAVFAPGIICLGCVLFIVGVIIAAFVINPPLNQPPIAGYMIDPTN
jgi:hypothetical protein